MRAVGRIFATLIGYAAAVIAAAFFLLAARVGLTPEATETAGWFWAQFAIYGSFAANLIGASTVIPAVVLIVVAEIFRIRSFVAYAAVGGAFGLAAALGVGSAGGVPAPGDLALAPNASLLVATGFIGGIVYWALAGRMAGLTPRRVMDDPASPRT